MAESRQNPPPSAPVARTDADPRPHARAPSARYSQGRASWTSFSAGSRPRAIADGAHAPLRESNLPGAQHIRYGAYGGIACHHIACNYIALFITFIPCGVWEAVHILDGLIKNRFTIQPVTLNADCSSRSAFQARPARRNGQQDRQARPFRPRSDQPVSGSAARTCQRPTSQHQWRSLPISSIRKNRRGKRPDPSLLKVLLTVKGLPQACSARP
ncbi:Tn3 family transposase [Martelella lutilitoris]|uniref:Tn3 family transposase n=1 Tax=Martelella lutilitoris TaxID=2583532 RepID=UPI003CCC6485